jgi:hypothetical protein
MTDYRSASDPPTPAWPLHVRVLAVSYVLSYAVQWLAFIGFTGTAAVLYVLKRRLYGLPLGLGVGGIICFILCGAFRRWFVQWGKRKYPTGTPK